MEKIPNSRYPDQLDRLIDEENNVTCNNINVSGQMTGDNIVTKEYVDAKIAAKSPSGYFVKHEIHENVGSDERLVCSVDNVQPGVYMVALYGQFRTDVSGTVRKQYLYIGDNRLINEENYPHGGWFQHTVTSIIKIDAATTLQYKVASDTSCIVDVELKLVKLY